MLKTDSYFVRIKVADKDHPLHKQLAGSDDLSKHESVFIYAYHTLINDRIATARDFERQNGWIRSGEAPNLYFVYVNKERYYLNVTNGHITKGKPNV
jgi:hypothetical protein